MTKGLPLEELRVYTVAMEIGDIIWEIVSKWDSFSKRTIGVQIVNAADSIASNLAEGYGRYHYKENKNFCYYSRGSAKETLSVLQKAKTRRLISQEEFDLTREKLSLYFYLVNGYINSIGKSKSSEHNN